MMHSISACQCVMKTEKEATSNVEMLHTCELEKHQPTLQTHTAIGPLGVLERYTCHCKDVEQKLSAGKKQICLAIWPVRVAGFWRVRGKFLDDSATSTPHIRAHTWSRSTVLTQHRAGEQSHTVPHTSHEPMTCVWLLQKHEARSSRIRWQESVTQHSRRMHHCHCFVGQERAVSLKRLLERHQFSNSEVITLFVTPTTLVASRGLSTRMESIQWTRGARHWGQGDQHGPMLHGPLCWTASVR